MKRKHLLPLLLILVLPMLVWAVADETGHKMFYSGTDLTVDSQFSGGGEVVDSIIVAAIEMLSDSTLFSIRVTGVAVMDGYDKLYIGFGNDSANRVDSATGASTGYTNSNLDTFLIVPPFRATNKMRVPFAFSFMHPLDSVAVTDTFYLNAYCGGSSTYESVPIEDVVFTIEVTENGNTQ